MVRTPYFRTRTSFRPGRLAWGLSLCGFLTLGCAQFPASRAIQSEPVVRGANPAQTATHLPPPSQVAPSTSHRAKLTFAEPPPVHQVPIDIDSVLRLAQDQNTRVHI